MNKCKPIYVKAFNHIVNEHEKKPCTICGEMLKERHRKRHFLLKHRSNSELELKCKFCGKGFVSNQRLKDHVNIHTGEKPYMCNFCGAAFASQGNWRMHQKTVHLGHKRGQKNLTKVDPV